MALLGRQLWLLIFVLSERWIVFCFFFFFFSLNEVMKFHVIGMVSKAEIKLVIENGQATRKVTGIAEKYTALSNKLCFSDKSARKSSNVKQANKSTHNMLDKQVYSLLIGMSKPGF